MRFSPFPAAMKPPSRRLRTWLPPLLLAAATAACADAPTGPDILARPAAGVGWIAATAPERLPVPASFAPALPSEAAARLRELDRLAWTARADGDLSAASTHDAESLAVLRAGLQTAGPAQLLPQGFLALDQWTERMEAVVAAEANHYPGLAESVMRVQLDRFRAAAAMERGDTVGAALALAVGAQRVQLFTPRAVALRVLRVAERALQRPGAEQLPEVRRVRHLLHTARDAAGAGEPYRALQRALYALQLLHGHELLHEEDINPLLRCGIELCDA